MHPDKLGGYPDHVHRTLSEAHDLTFLKRSCLTSSSRSSARASRISRSRRLSFFGTTRPTRTMRLPFSAPFFLVLAAPVPLHSPHASSTGTPTRVVTPRRASSKLSLTFTVILSPFALVLWAALALRPKISPRFPKPPSRSEKSSKFAPPGCPAPWEPKKVRGPSSYSLLFSGVERTS